MSTKQNYVSELDELCTKFLTMVKGDANKIDWRPLYEKEDAQVYHSKHSKTRYRIQGELSNTPESCFDLLSDASERPKFDEMCESGQIIETLDDHTAIVYSKMKGIWPTAPRDVVLLSHVRKLENGQYICINKSVEHSDFPDLQASKGIVRMQCDLAGTLCMPHEEDSRKCRVLQIADGDLRGNIPKWLLTFVATIGLPKSFRRLESIVKELEISQMSKFFSPKQESPITLNRRNTLKKLEARLEKLESQVSRQFLIYISVIVAILSSMIVAIQYK